MRGERRRRLRSSCRVAIEGGCGHASVTCCSNEGAGAGAGTQKREELQALGGADGSKAGRVRRHVGGKVRLGWPATTAAMRERRCGRAPSAAAVREMGGGAVWEMVS